MAYTRFEVHLDDPDSVEVDRLDTARGDWTVFLADGRKQANLSVGLTDAGAQALLCALLDRVGAIPEAQQSPRLRWLLRETDPLARRERSE